jgi:hypothetical protein
MTVEGIDISHWQATTPGLGGLGFVAVRASYGAYGDGSYPMHARNVRAAREILIAYHFGRNATATGDTIAEQVATFLRVGGAADGFALDVESDGGKPRMSDAQAKEFMDRVQQTGREIGLYMSESAFRTGLGQDWNWVANWSSQPRIPFRIWQWHGGPMDRNRFMGSLDTLRALFSDQVKEEPDVMNGWTAPTAPALVVVPKGSAIYRNSDFTADTLNVISTSVERELLYLGKVRNSARQIAWIVSYDNPDDTSGFRAHFLKDRAYVVKDVAGQPQEPPPAPDISTELELATAGGYNAALEAAVRAVSGIPRKPTPVQVQAAEGHSLMGGMPKDPI